MSTVQSIRGRVHACQQQTTRCHLLRQQAMWRPVLRYKRQHLRGTSSRLQRVDSTGLFPAHYSVHLCIPGYTVQDHRCIGEADEDEEEEGEDAEGC